MSINNFLLKNTKNLNGKTIAITGSTGGIGQELCKYLCSLDANLILLDRNKERSFKFKEELLKNYGNINIECVPLILDDFKSVKEAAELLKQRKIDVFIHNAGAYKIERKILSTNFDNIFQINFVSPYYIISELLESFRLQKTHIVAVSSIAHNYSKADKNDVDFSSRKSCALAYGNSKRFLMFSLMKLIENEKDISLSIAHPGISFTNITNHYPKLIFAIIKNPMKIIFMKPKSACLSILKAVFHKCRYREWIGPSLFDIWGYPRIKKLKNYSENEIEFIDKTAKEIYFKLKNPEE